MLQTPLPLFELFRLLPSHNQQKTLFSTAVAMLLSFRSEATEFTTCILFCTVSRVVLELGDFSFRQQSGWVVKVPTHLSSSKTKNAWRYTTIYIALPT